ncbi:MAG: Zn-dependent alcohol dehydrogenase [Pseudomonadota bacterium]|nr:Zn-dependent alcohol dehydrogenase [Pseudomonadota bacterium]
MKIKAAVLYEPNKPMAVETIDLDEPREGEVLVRIAAAGVCYSDYHIMIGEWSHPLPVVLGHEGAGVVERVGPGVTRLAPGQTVILNFRANCGTCHYCVIGRPVLCDGVDAPRNTMFDGSSRLSKDGQTIHHMARTSCFAEYAVVPESGAVPVRADMPLDKGCLVGCAVMTGVGSVVNTARIEAGSSVAVIGCGGVGLNAVQGAVLAGSGQIIAVDLLDNKLEYAREFGATDLVNGSSDDAVKQVLKLTGRGVDYAFEAIGNAQTIHQAYHMLAPGGTAVVVGMAPENDEVSINALSFPRTEKAIVGSWYGGARPWVDLPKITDLYLSGKLKIDPLISRTYSLDDINIAYDALAAGEVARSIISFE